MKVGMLLKWVNLRSPRFSVAGYWGSRLYWSWSHNRIDAADPNSMKVDFIHRRERNLLAQEMLDYYVELVNSYPILSIEGSVFWGSLEDFGALTTELWDTIIVGDDLFVTNIERPSKGVDMGSSKWHFFEKFNQIGTLSESFWCCNHGLQKRL